MGRNVQIGVNYWNVAYCRNERQIARRLAIRRQSRRGVMEDNCGCHRLSSFWRKIAGFAAGARTFQKARYSGQSFDVRVGRQLAHRVANKADASSRWSKLRAIGLGDRRQKGAEFEAISRFPDFQSLTKTPLDQLSGGFGSDEPAPPWGGLDYG
jgi:hypothetical protein